MAALTSNRAGNDLALHVSCLKWVAQVEHESGNLGVALEHYATALKVGLTLRLLGVQTHTLRCMADIHLEQGDSDAAEFAYGRAVSLYRLDGATSALDMANTLKPYALLQERTGSRARARALWQEAQAAYAAARLQTGVDDCAAHISALSDATEDDQPGRHATLVEPVPDELSQTVPFEVDYVPAGLARCERNGIACSGAIYREAGTTYLFDIYGFRVAGEDRIEWVLEAPANLVGLCPVAEFADKSRLVHARIQRCADSSYEAGRRFLFDTSRCVYHA